MDELEKARLKIEEVDRQMAALFERRMEAAKEVALYKKERGLPIYVPEREQKLIQNNAQYIGDDTVRAHYVQFLQHTMNVSKRYQREFVEGARIAYSGVEGAFANIAAGRIFPEGTLVSFPGFSEAYAAVVSGDCDQAVLPIENSYAGEVGQVMDLMFRGNLYVNAVYTLRIKQNLLGLPGARLSDITKVVSHPQALMQCRNYISSHGFAAEEMSNTAVAAASVASGSDIHTAAIASLETAELYGLTVIDHDINESAENATRFAVFSRVQNMSTAKASKFMLMFTVRNEAGSLAKAIDIIGACGFNMSALRSRPMGGLAWQYYFFVEASGNIYSPDGQAMLRKLSASCELLKVVGNYPEPAEL